MKRYIILSAMLVSALCISAQNTNPAGRHRTSGTAVKEKRASEVENQSITSTDKSTERRVNATNRNQGPGIKTNSEVHTRTSSSASNRKASVYGNEERATQTISSTKESVVRTRINRSSPQRNSNMNNPGTGNTRYDNQERYKNENAGIRERSPGYNRPAPSNINRPHTYTGVSSRDYVPGNEQESVTLRKTYVSPERRIITRAVPKTHYIPKSVDYRRIHYPYHVPPRVDIIWNVRLYNEYRNIYPHYKYWYYPVGYRVHTVSAYDAYRYVGEFARIYGKVYDVWYSLETDEYYLYFGEPYPYQDFTIIINGRVARRFTNRPERYFTGRHIAVTGVVSVYEGKPEMLIKKRSQIDLYF